MIRGRTRELTAFRILFLVSLAVGPDILNLLTDEGSPGSGCDGDDEENGRRLQD